MAALRAGSDDRERIGAAYAATEAAGGDVEAFIGSELEVRTAILEASGNQFRLPVAHAIRATLPASLRQTPSRAGENRRVSVPLRAAVLEGVLRGNEDGAAAAMKKHLDDIERRRDRAIKASADNDGGGAGGRLPSRRS